MPMFLEFTQHRRTNLRYNKRGEDYTKMVDTKDGSGDMSVVVLFDGLAVAGAQVFLYHLVSGHFLDRGLTDSAGKVVFKNIDATSVGAGDYFVVAKLGNTLNVKALGRL